jgi:hypothetical protein
LFSNKSVITGLIKGTEIANLFIKRDGTYAENESGSAKNFYQKSKRVYDTYKHFPKPIAQIYFAKGIC